MSSPLPPIVIVGAGRLGATLLRDLARCGVPVLGWARPSERRERVQAWLSGQGLDTPGFVTELPSHVAAALLAVPDRQVEAAAATLGKRGVAMDVLLHAAGALPVDPLRAAGALACGSCHPLAAVADPLLPSQRPSPLRGALFAVDGDPAALEVAQRIARSLGGWPVEVGGGQRAAYHAAAALIANDWVALADAALRTACAAGLPEAELRQGLLHLAQTALSALQDLPRDQALLRGLTGAVARGDATTLASHLAAIADPQVLDLHRQASGLLVDRCTSEGILTAQAAAGLRAALAAHEPSAQD